MSVSSQMNDSVVNSLVQYGDSSVAYYSVFLTVGLGLVLVNLFIMSLLCRSPTLLKPHNIYVIHMCVADLLVGLGLVFWAMTRLMPPGSSQEMLAFWLCATSLAFSLTSLAASVLCLLTMSVERYIKVILPLRHASILKPQMLHGMRVGCWVLAVTCGVVAFFLAKKQGHGQCRRDVHTYFSMALFSIALILLTFLHGAVLHATLKQRRQIRSLSGGHMTGQRRRHIADLRLALMVALLFGLLYICWLPSLIVKLANLLSDCPSEQLGEAVQITLVLRYFSTVFNPIIFNTFNADFRREVISRMTSLCKQKNWRSQRTPKLTVSAIVNMRLTSTASRRQHQSAELPVNPFGEKR